jgi:MoaA/NifB/PqqE/SkfB family radical SAM enzyme
MTNGGETRHRRKKMVDEERYHGIKGFVIYNPSKILLYMKEWAEKTPVFIELHPSTICNHKCIWCRYWGMAEKNVLSKEHLLGLFDKFPALAGIRITGGGEPLVNKHTPIFIKECGKRGIKTSLETNGGLFTPEVIDVVGSNCQYCRISLDAATSKTYNVVHRSTDFNKVLENIKLLSKTDLSELGISFLVTQYNVWEIPKFVDLNLPVSYIHFKPLIEGIDKEIKKIALEKIKALAEKVSYAIKYDRMIEDYYYNKNIECEIWKLIRVIGGDGKEYVCCEHAYEPEFESNKWDGSTEKCIQCRYNNYNEVIDMFKSNSFTKEFL